jgi:hypothetical protein
VFDRFVDTIAAGKRVSFWWTMGVNQGHESTRTAQAIINLALMTGNIGRPGTGANSITGQCNAMGSRLFANATSLPGGRDTKNPTHRREVAEILDIPVERIPAEYSLAYDQIIDGIDHDFHGRSDAMIQPFDSNKIFIRRKPVIFRLRQRGLQAGRPGDARIQIEQMNEKTLRVIHRIRRAAIESDPLEQRATAS